MPTTYSKIATVTVGSGGAADIQFTSIPQTYTDLKIVACGRLSTSGLSFDSYDIKFNGSSSSFSGRYLYGGGSSVSSGTGTNYAGTVPAVLATANTFGNSEIYIPNYTGSTNKSFSVDAVAENNATAGEQVFYAGLWSNTAAITSIALIGYRGNIVQYSTATLYGIKKS